MEKIYLTPKQIVENYPFYKSIHGIRHALKLNVGNIRSICIKLGGRIFFDAERFEAWVQEQTFK